MNLKITKPGSLLSVIHDQEITPAQASIVIAVLKDAALTYSEALAWLSSRRLLAERNNGLDSPAGAGDEVEAYRG